MLDTGSAFAGSIRPLNRESVSSSIMNMITDYLLSRDLKPGDKLPTESEFALQLGVGRNSVREAIKMLSSLGIVEIKRGVGTFIAKSISSSIMNPLILALVFEQGTSKELLELRLLIDTGAAELVILKATEEDIKKLEEVNEELKRSAEANAGDKRKRLDCDIHFHHTLLDMTRNPFLAKIGKAIYTLFFASIEKTVETDPISGYKNHKLVIDGIRRRDIARIREITRESLSFWRAIAESLDLKKSSEAS
jgi:GntR family transcriptional regulator, transcriptional repressor for pyruvate dehydrogenase complex